MSYFADEIIATQAYSDGTFNYQINALQCSGNSIISWLNTSVQGTTPTQALQQAGLLNMSRIFRNQCGSYLLAIHNNYGGQVNDLGRMVDFNQGNYPLNNTYYDVMTSGITPGDGNIVSCVAPDKAPQCSPEGIPSKCGNPIWFDKARKVQIETDYAYAGGSPLSFTRRFDSSLPYYTDIAPTRTLGSRWHHNHEFNIVWMSDQNLVLATRGDGRVVPFHPGSAAGQWVSDADINDTLVYTGNGWTYTTADKTVESYNFQGHLLSRQFPTGMVLTYTLDSAGRPKTITDSYGNVLTLAYDGSGRLQQLTLPDTTTITYGYDASNNLQTATYQDQSVKTYGYVGNGLLATLTDESKQLYDQWGYTNGNATSTTLGGGIANQYTLTPLFDTNNNLTSLSMIDPLGATHQIGMSNTLGVNRPISETITANNTTYSRTQKYDANGNLASLTDFNGNTTTYNFDAVRNLELSRTEASGTPQARTITTQPDPKWPLPATITEPGRVTTFIYDANTGVLNSKSVTANSKTRIWAWTYFPSYGQIKTYTDPDGNVTAYTYDAKGNVASITNPKGQVTSFPTYDANGRPLAMNTPDGLQTTFTYYPRGWLKTRQTGNALTSYVYYPTGLLQQVTLPNGLVLTYSYDQAHRLSLVSDNRGNQVSYALDNLGNVTQETRTDPSGTLAVGLAQAQAGLAIPNQVTAAK